MYGFREMLCTQDAMALIKKEVVDAKNRGRALLGLDLQSAFDKVKHSAILQRVEELGFGRRSYDYIRDFLTGRTAKLQVGELDIEERELGSVGTPQGSVISPLLFNLVMTKIARRLETQSVRHTIYADDITLWSVRDEEQQAQDELQEAVLSIEEELEGTGLACSPSKSELLVINPKKKTWNQLTVQTGTGQVIPRVKKIRILGLIVDETRKNMETVHKLEHKTNAAIQLVKRVANRKGGMRENSLLRMVQSFVISHLAYIAAFHNWKYNEKKRLNCMIRKAYKNALGLYASTNTEKMESLGVHNRLEEVIVAQRTAQVARLEKTRTGRETLRKLKIEAQTGPEDRQVDSTAMGRLDIRPIPRHMHPVHDEGRRKARAQALTREHGEDSGTVHVDAARHGDHFVAAVVRAKDGGLVTAASIRTQEVRVAEEVAIALAASLPTVKVVLSDSMRALRNFMAGRISQAAARTLDNKSCGKVTLKWYPAHEEGNAVADAMARALGDRAGSQSSHYEPREYGEMLRTFRLDRQLLPAPHPNLTRKEAVVFRQLQTRCMFTPVIGKHILPDLFQDDVCKLCKSDRATLAHIAWDCTKRRREASQEADLPPEFKDATESDNYEVQLQAVQQIAALLERQSPRRVLATT